MATMETGDAVDLRGKPVPGVGNGIMARYDAMAAGGRALVLCDAYGAALRVWLAEAGVRHTAREAAEGHWELEIERRASPSLTAAPGLHHLVSAPGGTVWACERAARAVRLDGHTGEIEATAKVAGKASHLALSPDEKWLYVADFGAGTLVAADAETLEVRHVLEAPGGPQLPSVSPDGIACVCGAAAGAFTIVWPAAGGPRAKTIEIGPVPHDQVITEDGKYAFVSCAGDATVAKVDLFNGAVLARYPVGQGPGHLAAHPDGERIYVANTFDGTVTCLSVEGDDLGRAYSGEWAHHPVVAPGGATLWVVNFGDDTLAVFDALNLELLAMLETEPYAHELAFSGDGKYALAPGYCSDHVRLYDVAARTETARVPVGWGSPHGTFLGDSHTAWVACSVDNHLAKLDADSGECVQRVGAL